MDAVALEQLLEAVRTGSTSPSEARELIAQLPFTDLQFARVDHHRELRQGIPEVVFAPGKSAEQIVAIAHALQARAQAVLVTRLDANQAASLLHAFPQMDYNPVARTAFLASSAGPVVRELNVVIVTGGTADLAVAEEARETLRACGCTPRLVSDVGVAGLHRLLAELPQLRAAQVVIAVAGMEGALPSVLGGLLAAPIIAVPTSIGYGSAFGGLAALLAMLNSCASGVTVVNIDNGFGAAVAAVRLADQLANVARTPARGGP
jgi:pyridinium-3,5-biscarboxylic acid mononucleotide synthase